VDIYSLLRSASLFNKLSKKVDISANIGNKAQLEQLCETRKDIIFIVDPMLFWYDTAIKTLDAQERHYVIYDGDLEDLQNRVGLYLSKETKLDDQAVQEAAENSAGEKDSELTKMLKHRIENPLNESNWRGELAEIAISEEHELPAYGEAAGDDPDEEEDLKVPDRVANEDLDEEEDLRVPGRVANNDPDEEEDLKVPGWPGGDDPDDGEDLKVPGWPGGEDPDDEEDLKVPGWVAGEDPDDEEDLKVPGWPGGEDPDEEEDLKVPGWVAGEDPDEEEDLKVSGWVAGEDPEGEEGQKVPGWLAGEDPEDEVPKNLFVDHEAAAASESNEAPEALLWSDNDSTTEEAGLGQKETGPKKMLGLPIRSIKSLFEKKPKQSSADADLKKLSELEPSVLNLAHRIGTVTVAIAGATNRVGTTHHAIQAALYLKRFGKVACCEFASPDEAVFWTFNPSKTNPFEYEGVTFYPCCTNFLSLLYSKEFDFIVLDLGSIVKNNELHEKSGEFVRASQKVLVSGASIWDCNKLMKALEMLHIRNFLSGTHVVLNLSSQQVFQEISGVLDNKRREQLGVKLYEGQATPGVFTNLDTTLYSEIFST